MNQYDGKQYMMPINTNTYVLYYNKDLLEAGGYSEPPKTMEELFEMGTALTKVEDGQIVQIGLPLAESNILKYMTFAAGYDFGTVDEIDLANEGMEKALTLISQAVSEIGSDALNAYSSSANSMWWGEEDYFRQGMSVFRVDGPWFYKMAAASGINVGAVCIPAFADQGDKLATGLETSNLYIPSNADGVDGAWDFMKFFALGDGAKMFATTDGSLPAVESLREDTDIIATFDTDGASLSTLDGSVELKYVPNRVDTGDINSAISTAKDAVILGDPIADIMAELQTVEDTCNGK